MGIEELQGRTVTEIKEDHNGDGGLLFICEDGSKWLMQHFQDCCEHVYLEDTAGDIKDLIGYPIIEADEESSHIGREGDDSYCPESQTWTFYKIGTAKGSVTLRWYGTSNGYYSESVSFIQVEKENV